MARWRLMAGHYLYTDPPTEWEHKETSRETGRQTTVRHIVPRHLDPKDPADHNYPDEIVVSNGKGAQKRDIIFFGEPTPDMEPIDDEAKAISQEFIDSGKWNRQVEGLDYGEGLIQQFLKQMERIQTPAPQPISATGIDPKAFADLQGQVKALIEQNAQLQAQILEKPARRA